jgi:hypothetical protein
MEKLLFFYGLECPHCRKMEKLVDRLNLEGYTIKKVETWHDKENEKLFERLDKECAVREGGEECGGVPFFMNQKSGKFICGEVSYKKLKDWADGK